MVLKDKKAVIPKRAAKSDNEAASILSRLESPNASNILPSLKAHLEPVCKLEAPLGKENASDAEKHRIAKQFVPFLAQVLKLCSSGLSKLPISDDFDGKVKADELFLSLDFALDCFEQLRQWLVGSPFEIEMQRSWLVRRLIAWRRFHEALDQDLRLLHSLCSRVFKTDVIRSKGCKYKEVVLKLPHPDHAKELTQAVIVLIVGAATDFIVCAAEIGFDDLTLLEKVVAVAQQVEPWLSKLEADKAEKQRSLLFRELNKCVMATVSDNVDKQPELMEALGSVILHQCALSSMNDHFCKVARSICSRLNTQGPANAKLAVKVCEEALAKISQIQQLQGIRGTHDILELVECYARLCQTSKSNFDGWEHICRAIGRNSEEPMMAVAGCFAVGLVVTCDLFETSCQIAVTLDSNLEQRICYVLEDAFKAVEKVLACFNTGLKCAVADVVSKQMKVADQRKRKSLVSVYRALDFLRRSAFSYAQLQWDAFIARSEGFYGPLELHGALRHCLLLFCKLVNAGLKCSSLTPDESELFKKGSKSFFLAANAAFRLSLLKQDGDEESVKLINNSMGDPFAGPEELRWLMSSSYNMGVQLFNLKLHELACEPFRISHAAAWERVSRISLNQASSNFEPTETDTTHFNEIITDACAKSNILFDTLNRNNNVQEALNVFCDTVGRWARSGLAGFKKHSPHSFLQLWLKKIFAMKLDQEKENVICFFTLQFDPPLRPDAVGLLLEEELLFYDNIEGSDSNLTLQMKNKILDLLLDRVYTTDVFLLQQSKILREKARLCRLHNVEGYSGCLGYLTQAINVVSAENMNVSGGDSVWTCAKLQLAVDYFLRALCLQEIDPSQNDFLEDILNGSRLCEGLFSCKAFVDESFLAQIPAATGVLQNVADLLAFKGYSNLQYKVYGLLLDIASASHANPEDAFVETMMNKKLSHLFCCSPFLHTLKNLVKEKLGLDLDSIDVLQNLLSKDPQGVLAGFLSEFLKDFSREIHDIDFDDNLALSIWTELSRTSDDPKTNESLSKLSQAFFMVSECSKTRGNLEEALRNAKEALRFRLKLLNRSFKMMSKSPMVGAAKTEPSDVNQKVIYLQALGCVAVNCWPNMNLAKKSEVGPSQWQIIGDYLESLMQVGVLCEMLGLVDDAESSFREGCQIAKSQSLPFAEGLFQSHLGETQRKRHLWQLAESSFECAAQLLDQQEIGLICQQCKQFARACLEFRVADFERHRSNGNSVESIRTSKLALDGYVSAESRILCLLTDLSNARSSCSEMSCLQHNQGADMCETKLEYSSLRAIPLTMEDNEPSRNRLRNSARIGRSCSLKSLAGAEETCSEVLPGRPPEKELCKPSVPCTRRKASAKPRGGKGSVPLPEGTVEDLCGDTIMKLNIQERKLSGSGKIQVATEITLKERKPSTRKKGSVVDSVDKANLEWSSALGEEKRSVEQVTKQGEPGEQVSCGFGRRKSCLLHGSSSMKKQSSLYEWLDHKWIAYSRRLIARILVAKGKCLQNLASAHEVHTQFYRALAALKDGDLSVLKSSDSSSLCGTECLSTKVSNFSTIEEGCALYHISIFALKQGSSKRSRVGCCCFESVEMNKVSQWLCHAFMLCREMPPLLCKVARLLAILHVPKDLGGPFDCSFIDGSQSSRAAPYFHQISLGATTRQQHLSALDARKASERSKISDLFDAGLSIDEMQQALRIGPSTTRDLQLVLQEDIKLPCSTICLSLVDWEMQYLYGSLEEIPSDAWLLVSRFDTDLSPLSIILQCAPLPERFGGSCCPYNLDAQDGTASDVQSGIETAFSNVATKFKIIMDESHQSTSGVLSLNSVEEKSRWWEWRMDLDARLASLLRGMEEIWLGPWKSMLLGNRSVKGSDAFKCSAESLKKQLESITKTGPLNVDLIQLLLQGAGSLSRGELEKGVAWLLDGKTSTKYSTKDVQIKASQNGSTKSVLINSTVGAFVKSFEALVQGGACLSVAPFTETNSNLCGVVEKNLSKSFECMEEPDFFRDPVALVLDRHLQVLPWESLPVLRKKEVYRVPSIGSMKALMIQRSFLEALNDKQGSGAKMADEAYTIAANRSRSKAAAAFDSLSPENMIVPTIDPCNTYFLLNPSGDLGSTQAAFEDMFKCQQGWEGKVGQVPTIEEYMDGLQKHELFVYFGHGSGDQYLPERRMRKLNRCAAALLMGCSSGRLSPRGDYEPVGVPLWYLMSGCPTAIANLWDVTDGDIDRFSRVILNNWLESDGAQAKAVIDGNSKMKNPIESQSQKGKKRGQKLCKTAKDCANQPVSIPDKCFSREARTASHIGEGRNTCRLPNLIGASPVCYGIPTLIKKKS